MVGTTSQALAAVDGLAAEGDLYIAFLIGRSTVASADRAAVVCGEQYECLILGIGCFERVRELDLK